MRGLVRLNLQSKAEEILVSVDPKHKKHGSVGGAHGAWKKKLEGSVANASAPISRPTLRAAILIEFWDNPPLEILTERRSRQHSEVFFLCRGVRDQHYMTFAFNVC